MSSRRNSRSRGYSPETSPAGPYDHWPLQRGFDCFHGFMPGETNQWNPELITGNERVEPPRREGYHLSEDIVDQSCKWLRQLASADPDQPFFLYVAFTAGHSPHHVPAAYVIKYRGKFDGGWDKARKRILARQKASGLLPEDQRLAPRNPGVQVWDELDADEKLLAARLMEVNAGFMDHADEQIGRLLRQIAPAVRARACTRLQVDLFVLRKLVVISTTAIGAAWSLSAA